MNHRTSTQAENTGRPKILKRPLTHWKWLHPLKMTTPPRGRNGAAARALTPGLLIENDNTPFEA